MIFFNGLKRLLISLLTLHLLLSSLSAVNIHKQFTANSEEYKDVVNLCILTGTALPSSMTPVSAKELLLALDRIDYNNLSKALKELYDSAYKKIAGSQSNINLDPLFITTNPSLGIEAYAQTQSDTWLSSNDWTNQYRDRLKLVELPIEIGISNYFYGRVIPELSLQFTQPMGENREGFTEFNKIFTTNIDIRKGTQRSMPLVSEAVIGTDFLHLYIGRNRQALGLGQTGNLMIGDNFIYQDFGKFTIHTNYFTYNLSITVFDRQKNTLIDEYTPLGATKLSSTSFNGKKQYRVVNNYQINLLTVEDPPEYPIPGARQMPVTNANTEEEKNEQFTKALSAALRSDPDVILVGETRSLSTAELTFKGALSGHGVWTTLHANSAPAIVTRLRDMGIQPYLLNDPELVKGLVSQRLFRKLCPNCRQSIKTKEGSPEFDRLRNALGDYGIENVYVSGPGCKACGYKGFKGRMAVDEIILPDSRFLRLMIDNETAKAIDYWVSELNGRPLKDAAIERMIKGQIDMDEVERWCGLIDQRPVY